MRRLISATSSMKVGVAAAFGLAMMWCP
jgi:hypothetical protein